MGCSACASRAKSREYGVSNRLLQGCEAIRDRLIKLKKLAYSKYKIEKNKLYYQDYLELSKLIRERACPEVYIVEAYEIEYLK